MSRVVRNMVFLANLFLLIQISLAATTGETSTSAEDVPVTEETNSDAHELSHEDLAHSATRKPGPDDLQLNKDAFEALQYHFGDIGPLMYDVVTSRNALGEEFARASKVIASYMNLEKYRHSIGTILELADRTNFSERLSPLFARVADIPDPTGTETFGDAVEIIKNIMQDPNAIAEIRRRVTRPSRISL